MSSRHKKQYIKTDGKIDFTKKKYQNRWEIVFFPSSRQSLEGLKGTTFKLLPLDLMVSPMKCGSDPGSRRASPCSAVQADPPALLEGCH